MAVASLGVVRPAESLPETVFVPGGRFSMGSETGRLDEAPVHEAEVRPLRVGRTPVTNLAYAWFLATGRAPEPPWWRDPAFWDPDQPVVGVTWFEAMAYCLWLGETLGGMWRLPTEAEWERSARAGLHQAKTSWGRDVPTGELKELPLSGPWTVGRGRPNAFGLLDPGTLVREWCHDWYAVDAYRSARRYDPRGPESGTARVRRGGSWRDGARGGPLSSRHALDPHARAADAGFRVVREVP